MPPPDEKTLQEKVARAQRILNRKLRMKPLYKELDALTLELKRHPKLLAGVGLMCRDNFRKTNTAYRKTAISRYELDFAAKPKKAAAKK